MNNYPEHLAERQVTGKLMAELAGNANRQAYPPKFQNSPPRLARMFFKLCTRLDGTHFITEVNEEFCTTHGFKFPAQVTLPGVLAVIHSDDRCKFEASFSASLESMAPWLHEYRVVVADGRIIWLSGSALPTPSDDGTVHWAGFVVDITGRKTVEEKSRFLTERNRLLMRTATDGLHILDSDGYIVEASDNFARLLGYVTADMAGMHVSAWDEKWNDDGRWKKHLGADEGSKVREAVYRKRNGLLFPVEVFSSTATFDGRIYVSSTSHDVSGRKRDENELRMAAAAFEAKQSMFITDAVRRVVRINHAFSEQTGYVPAETIGKLPPIFRSGLYDEHHFSEVWKEARTKGFWSGEMFNRRKDGSVYPVRVSLTAVNRKDGAVSSYVGTEIDITAEKEAEKQITRLAYYDALTGLPNRRLLQERLEHSVALSRRTGSLGAVLFIDLDNFKQLNDQAGHDVGDMLLVQVSKRLVGSLRDTDTVARLGGDEFVVMLENLAEDSMTAAKLAESVSSKILAELNVPYNLSGHEHACTPSIGFTLFGERDEGVEELIKRADLAMYHAKAMGRNGIRFFDLEMRRSLKDRATRLDDIKRGIKNREFELHYQPQISMNGEIFGAEALVRWKHPTLGLLMPLEFVPLAEEVGIIVELGQLILETACRQLVHWATLPILSETCVSVNVSARQFRQRDFVDCVLQTLSASGADASKLTLEITESVLVDNIDDTIATMNSLKEKGIRFSLDDFGIGYSSLSYLKLLPFDQLKIDRAFVSDILTNRKDAAIASTIISLGKNLSLEVVAEGVESPAQREYLNQFGCHAFQGYLISKALEPTNFENFIQSHQCTSALSKT